MKKRAKTSGPKTENIALLLGQAEGPLGQWPSSYNVERCPPVGVVDIQCSGGMSSVQWRNTISTAENFKYSLYCIGDVPPLY